MWTEKYFKLMSSNFIPVGSIGVGVGVLLGIGPPFGALDQILACSSSFYLTFTLICFQGALSDEKTGL
jgi:hypothetical protein